MHVYIDRISTDAGIAELKRLFGLTKHETVAKQRKGWVASAESVARDAAERRVRDLAKKGVWRRADRHLKRHGVGTVAGGVPSRGRATYQTVTMNNLIPVPVPIATSTTARLIPLANFLRQCGSVFACNQVVPRRSGAGAQTRGAVLEWRHSPKCARRRRSNQQRVHGRHLE